MKKISLIILGIFLINLTSAAIICVDHDPPTHPSNLILTASGNEIQLTWISATDTPSCSGIDYYNIFKNSAFLTSVEETNYLDIGLEDGTYIYIIYAFDLAGHEGNGTSNSITISAPEENGVTPPSGGGGSSGSDDISYWQCGEWEECINGTQIRICEDISDNLPNRTETKDCFPDFVPLDYETNKENETESPNQESSSTNFITGAVTGVTDFAKTGKGIGLIIAFLIVALGIGAIFMSRSKAKSP